jgi:hypothetical protein
MTESNESAGPSLFVHVDEDIQHWGRSPTIPFLYPTLHRHWDGLLAAIMEPAVRDDSNILRPLEHELDGRRQEGVGLVDDDNGCSLGISPALIRD